ncbi:MAG: methionyl-tRNA formyltransferase [Bacteroidales bacterium]
MTHPLRIIYMGTPDFAVYPLSLLVQQHYTISAVVTAPDKPAGRGKKIHQSPVKKFAESHNLPVLQPVKLRDDNFVKTIEDIKPDVIIVVAFRMLPKIIWSIPKVGTFNLHASLLPQYRGAAPINWAIVNGETETGVTTFFIDDNIDTGHIIDQKKILIPTTATAGDMHDSLMKLGGELIIETLQQIEHNSIQTIPQKKLESKDLKTAPKISKETCKIRWNTSVQEIYNHIRGFSPYPAAWFKISHTSASHALICKIYEAEYEKTAHDITPGTIIENKKNIAITCIDGYIYPTIIQLEGKKRMHITECLCGFSFKEASIIE